MSKSILDSAVEPPIYRTSPSGVNVFPCVLFIVESTLEVLTAKGGAEQDKEAESDQEKNGDVESPRKKRPESEAAESVDTNVNDCDSELELRPMIALCLAYAANIGGTASLIGTPPNLLLADALDEYDGQPINFLTWMGLALPQVCQSVPTYCT